VVLKRFILGRTQQKNFKGGFEMRKRMILLIWVLTVIFTLTISVSTQAQEKKFTAKLADILSPDHPHTRSWVYFAEKVKEKTKGRVEIQVYHSGQLGQTKDLYQGLQMGSIEMAKLPVSFTGEWIPEVYVFDLPYLFNNRDEMWRVFKSSVGQKFFNEIYAKQNLVGMMWADDGGRSVYTVNKAVRKPEDLKGLKIRVQPSAIHIQSINEMGGIATPTAWGEVYLALQQKVLDGAENSPVLFWTSKHWEVCKVYSLTEQFWLPTPLIGSKKWWDTIPKDLQAQIAEAAQEAEKYFIQIYTADEKQALGWAKEKGVQIVTDVDKAAFEKRIQPVYETFIKKYAFGKDLLDQVKAAKKK
jgi:tripartite ATP-independent transporter DctP family solute receptor